MRNILAFKINMFLEKTIPIKNNNQKKKAYLYSNTSNIMIGGKI